MNKFVYLYWISIFKVVSNTKAKELGLKLFRNVYGDEINHLNCRSIWLDKNGKQYRAYSLEY